MRNASWQHRFLVAKFVVFADLMRSRHERRYSRRLCSWVFAHHINKVMAKKATVKKPAAVKKRVRTHIAVPTESRIAEPQERSWQALFAVTEHWKSDLNFFEDELKFFHRLIDKYFMWLIEEKNIAVTRDVASGLVRLNDQMAGLEKRIDEHLRHLTNLIENPFPHDAQAYRAEHASLENGIAGFAKDFRALKKEIFKVAEHAIASEKTRHLLGQSEKVEKGNR